MVQLCPVPAGARITGFTLTQKHYGSVGADRPLDVRLTIGGTEVWNPIQSATAQLGIAVNSIGGVGDSANHVGIANAGTMQLGMRLTACAVMTFQIHNALGSGTAANTYRAITEYIYEERGD
jgi:hypothetical protein